MLMSTDAIRRHEDGSIDTGFYVAIGNRERARAVRTLVARLFGRSTHPTRRARTRRPTALHEPLAGR